MATKRKTYGGGHSCSVIGCHNNYRKLMIWRSQECAEHPGILHADCPCLIPFSFHSFPRDETLRKQWEIAVFRKEFNTIKSYTKVCSAHFLDGRPTAGNPIPTINLVYEKVPKVRRRHVPVKVHVPKKRMFFTPVQKSAATHAVIQSNTNFKPVLLPASPLPESASDVHPASLVKVVMTVDAETQCDDLCSCSRTIKENRATQCDDLCSCNKIVNNLYTILKPNSYLKTCDKQQITSLSNFKNSVENVTIKKV